MVEAKSSSSSSLTLRVVEDDSNSILTVTLKSVGRKFFKGRRAKRIDPVLTTKNEIMFEILEVLERVCENPGGTMALRYRRPWSL